MKIGKHPFEKYVLSWITGVSVFLLLSYALAFLELTPLLYIILAGFFIFSILYKKSTAQKNKFKVDYWLVAILILGSLSFLSLMFFSGYQTNEGLQFIGVNSGDGIIHTAYIKSQSNIFPPEHPGLSGVPLRGYHFFYDFLLSRFVVLYKFTAEDLYFRLFPAFIALLFGGSSLLLLKSMYANILAHRIGLFLLYFGQSTISLLYLFKHDRGIPELIQSALLILDPSVVLGTSLAATVIYLIPKIDKKIGYALIAGIILGVITQIKVYTGIIGIATLVLFTMYRLVTKRMLGNYILSLFIAGLLTLITFGLNNFGNGSLVFAPLLFYEQYMEQSFFDSTHWGVKKILFKENNNVIRLLILYAEGIAIFWLFNLGAKLVLFLRLSAIFKKSFWTNDSYVAFLFAIGSGIILPSFFIQSRSVFDIVQFLWVTVTLLAIPAGIIWADIFKKSVLFKTVSLCTILTFSVVGSAYNIYPYLASHNPLRIKQADVNIYNRIAEHIPLNSSVIFLPERQIINSKTEYSWPHLPLLAAMIGRPMYLEGHITPYVSPDTIKERENNIISLHNTLTRCDEKEVIKQLKQIGSFYILSTKPNVCLNSNKIKGVKLSFKTINFYMVQNL